jgi:hypothetical protein
VDARARVEDSTKYKHCLKERFDTCQKVAYVVTFQLWSEMLLAKERLVNANFLRIVFLLRPWLRRRKSAP